MQSVRPNLPQLSLPQPKPLLCTPLSLPPPSHSPCPRYKLRATHWGPLELELKEQGTPRCLWLADEESVDAESAPVSCPWFYPVVEQHDVTYHRVKPLAGHRETDTHRRAAPEATAQLQVTRPPRGQSSPTTASGPRARGQKQVSRPPSEVPPHSVRGQAGHQEGWGLPTLQQPWGCDPSRVWR